VVRPGAQNNKVYPEVDLLGNAELLERFFFLEGDVSVTQQFFTPFGGQPVALANATANRYNAESYAAPPHTKGPPPAARPWAWGTPRRTATPRHRTASPRTSKASRRMAPGTNCGTTTSGPS